MYVKPMCYCKLDRCCLCSVCTNKVLNVRKDVQILEAEKKIQPFFGDKERVSLS